MADDALVTQTVAELARKSVGGIKTTQTVVEIAISNRPPTDVLSTQTVVEYTHKHIGESRVTHTIVEIVRKDYLGGLYFINPTKVPRHDHDYEAERKIPNPIVRTTFIGE